MPRTLMRWFLLTHCDYFNNDVIVYASASLNKLMKAHGGLTGISNNPNARQRFFLATPELSCLATDFKSQFHSAGSQAAVQHDLSSGKVKREHGTITRIKEAIESHGNPFAVEGSAIYSLWCQRGSMVMSVSGLL